MHTACYQRCVSLGHNCNRAAILNPDAAKLICGPFARPPIRRRRASFLTSRQLKETGEIRQKSENTDIEENVS